MKAPRAIEQRKGELLVNAGIISPQQFKDASKLVHLKGITLLQAFLETKALSDNLKDQVMEFFYGADYVDLSKYVLDKEAVNMVTADFARHFSVIPMKFDKEKLLVAMSDPMDVEIEEHLRMQLKRPIKMVYAPREDIDRAIAIYYGSSLPIEEITAELAHLDEEEFDTEKDIQEASSPVSKLVDRIILQAAAMRSSDIHFEPRVDNLLIRFRIDGVLHDIQNIPKKALPSIMSRLKIMANLDITERRKPQDGRIEMNISGKRVDIRVSSVPVALGEKMVLRILDKSIALYGIPELGLYIDDEKKFFKLLKQTGGMILVTGPTGSGKTTTLYAGLNYLKSSAINIISLEDPVEFTIDGVNQIPINPKAGVTFATALRAVLRQDPDIIMVGEIRDLETAELAIQAALTGHLVLGTLHTRNAAGAITRLVDMGVPEYLIASTLIGAIAQRLVRKNCQNCTEICHIRPDDDIPLELKKELENIELMRGTGCDFCHNTGYYGRNGIFEIIEISEKLRKMITENAPISELTKVAREEGMLTLKEDALRRVKDGITTWEEMTRII